MNVIVRDKAYEDLERIHDWIAADNPDAARDTIARIFAAIDRLAAFPGVGHSGQVEGTREWVVRGLPYIVVYRIDEVPGLLAVEGVFHGARAR